MSTLKDLISLPNGARFYRADLHIHSYGASHDVKDKMMTPTEIVKMAISEKLDVIAITDHNEISNILNAIECAKGTNLLVIPAIELSTSQGHLLCYFPDFDSLQNFYGNLKIADKGKNTSHCSNSISDCLVKVREFNGFAILAHIDGDGGFDKIAGGATPHKMDIICDPSVLGIELLSSTSDISYSNSDTNKERTKMGVERINRLGLGDFQHLARVLNSDAHTLKMIGHNSKGQQKVTRFKMQTPSFNALRIALEDSDARVRLEEEIPSSIPQVIGISAEGGFLDGVKIHFSSNLNCIIGGRGTGKSTTFEGVRCLIKDVALGSAVDSEIWPDYLHIFWRDQAGQSHSLQRPLNGEIININDKNGPTSFEIESYAQGETTHISHSAKKDPLALLEYLDRFINVSDLEENENEARDELLGLWSKIEEARKMVAMIPESQRDLETKTKQLSVLATANAKEIIKLQRGIEEERRARQQITIKLSEMEESLDKLDVTEDIEEIVNIADPETLAVGSMEYKKIIDRANAYDAYVDGIKTKGQEFFVKFRDGVNVDLTSWKAKDLVAERKIENEKKKLIAQGIRLDMVFIKKLTEDEAKLKAKLKTLNSWVPHLKKLEKEYAQVSKKRWSSREKLAMSRIGYAKIASETLKSVLKDLTVSLKFITDAYSPEAQEQIISATGWRTNQIPRASLILEKVTLPKLIQAIDNKDIKPLLAIKTDEGVSIFKSPEAHEILNALSEPSVRFGLERSQVFDIPKLTVTGLIKQKDGTTKILTKDFTRLSLGQQQSVLLALMLSAKSNTPLIIDQPEDHLDSEFIYRTLVPVLRQAKERRQVIIVTHNPNIAVLGDAEQIIVLKSSNDKTSIVARGSIDDPNTRDKTCSVLEGAKEAFHKRAKIYGVPKTILNGGK